MRRVNLDNMPITQHHACEEGQDWFRAHYDGQLPDVGQVIEKLADEKEWTWALWLMVQLVGHKVAVRDWFAWAQENNPGPYNRADVEYWLTQLQEAGWLDAIVSIGEWTL